ncbi:MAG: hypothetical protein U5K30_12480 [Acidimicrobiales bacterium]|nr:hypothetical protein [Acidimicrobiales bacterium]
MAEQPRLLPHSFHLDTRSRDAGRRGLAKARAALAEAHRRNAAGEVDDRHATAA